MLFHVFDSQEERHKFGDSCFIELQYCRLPFGTKLKKIISVEAVKHWQNDSLYVFGDDSDTFYSLYHAIIMDGTYNNMERGLVDLYGINFYSQQQAAQIAGRLKIEKPLEYQTLLNWLEAGNQFVGFYILGL